MVLSKIDWYTINWN